MSCGRIPVELRVRNLEERPGQSRGSLEAADRDDQVDVQKLGDKIAKLNPELEYPQQIASSDITPAMGGLAAQHDIGITGATRQKRGRKSMPVSRR